jgi:hypothetical protein
MLLLSTIAGVAGALTLAAASPAAAAVPPVSIISCDYNGLSSDGGQLIPATAPFETSNLHVTFANRAPLAATDVRFAVNYAGHTDVIDDAGTFASGSTFAQDFTPSTNVEYTGSAQCSVQSVTFSDGSTWQPV